MKRGDIKAHLKLYDAKEFEQIGNQLISDLSNYIDQTTKEKIPVNNYKDPDTILNEWELYLNTSPDLNSFFRKVLEDSIHLHNPNYIGHQVSVPAPVGAFGGLISDLLNNGMAVFEMGAVANVLERKCIEILKEQFGFGDGSGGFLTSGGTLANLTALVTARNTKIPGQIWENGYKHRQYAVMVSEQAHYCIERAVKIMGMGSDGLIKLPVNDKFQVDPEQMANKYYEAKKKGIEVFAIVASSCSTATGSYDDLEYLAEFAQEKNLWLHVDGAHGAASAFSDKYKHLIKGIERADSVIIDFHKMMLSPTIATAVIYKRELDSYKTFNLYAEYLYADLENFNWFDSGKRTFECTKLMMALKVMSVYLHSGIGIFEKNVDLLYDKARNFAQLIDSNPNMELLIQPEANILCYRFLKYGFTDEQLNQCNRFIRHKIITNNQFYIVQTILNGKQYLRSAIMNPFTTIAHFENLIKTIEEIGNDYLNNAKISL